MIRLGLSAVRRARRPGAARACRRARRDPTRWEVEDGPFFANHMCLIEFSGGEARMVLERAEPDDDGRPVLTVAADSAL